MPEVTWTHTLGPDIWKHTIATFWLTLEEQGARPGSRAAGLQVGWLGLPQALLQKITRMEEHKEAGMKLKYRP